jgi:hypothetical protein
MVGWKMEALRLQKSKRIFGTKSFWKKSTILPQRFGQVCVLGDTYSKQALRTPNDARALDARFWLLGNDSPEFSHI